MVSDAAMERVPAEIVKTQSLRVDNVAGATLTSMAIQAAATNAVKAAGGQPSEYYKSLLRNSQAAWKSPTKLTLSSSARSFRYGGCRTCTA